MAEPGGSGVHSLKYPRSLYSSSTFLRVDPRTPRGPMGNAAEDTPATPDPWGVSYSQGAASGRIREAQRAAAC
eukprot:6943631-Prymnesium_polylepis.2